MAAVIVVRVTAVERGGAGMWQERPQQSIGVVVTLVGSQDVSAGVHLPLTDDAAVSVRIGSTLIYMHDPATVAKFLNACFDLAPEARRLPREVAPDIVAPVRGMHEPGVVVNAFGSPPASGVLVRVPGQLSYLRLQVGRVVLQMRDLGAYGSVATVFREAASLAPTAFASAEMSFRRQAALEQAAAVFPAARSRRRVARSPKSTASSTPALPVRSARPTRAAE